MIFVASVQCKTKFKIEVKKMPLQMNSFDWKWRECLLAVSVTKRMVKFFDNERQFLNYQKKKNFSSCLSKSWQLWLAQ